MLIRLQLLPDELALSYEGAIRRASGAQTGTSFERLTERWWTSSSEREPLNSRVQLLAEIAGVSEEFLVRHHTLLPLRRGIASYLPDVPHGAPTHRRLSNGAMKALISEAPRFCLDCVASDHCEYGRSYWRRQHQLPGLYWCPKHRRGLHEAKGDITAFEQCPAAHVGRAEEFDYEWAAQLWSDRSIQRYFSVVDALLDLPQSIRPSIARDALRLRAKPRGYQTHPGRGRVSPNTLRVLSDDVHELFPSSWLSRVFPDFKPKQEARQLQCKIDGVLWVGAEATSPPGYALVAAMLFDNGSDFMAAVSQARTAPPKAKRGRAARKTVTTA